MSNRSINIFFDYEGYYSNNQWIPREGSLYGLSFKTMEEITYSVLVDRICKKLKMNDSALNLKLSYIPLVVEPQTQSYIVDDEDVYVYLTSMDKEQRRSVLHVEVSTYLEIVPMREQHSRVERRSSVGMNYGERISSDIVNVGAVTLYVNEESVEQPHELMGNVYIGDGENQPNFSRNDVDNDIDIDVDNGVDNSEDMGLYTSSIPEYVELPRAGEESQCVDAWEDGIGIELGQEFESKRAVQDLVDRAAHQNCFGIDIANSDTNRYVVKCRKAKKGCKWYLRVAKLKNSTCFSVRVYTKMHTCSRASSSTSYKKKSTPQLVAALLHEDYPGKFETPTPKSIVSLVQRRYGVEPSYSTALRGKKLAVKDVRGGPEDSFRMLYAYLYMLEKVNLGTKTSVVLEETKRFKYLFVALGASIEGFEAMRKVIIVDATFLKTVHGGMLVFATAQDPSHHHYPIAFAVFDGEKDASWTWFFNTLKTIIPDSSELVFVSDRNQCLINAVGEVYPNAQHGYCIYHLSQNVRNKVSHVKKDVVAAKFIEIAKIYSEVEFQHQYADFRRRYPSVAVYLDSKKVKVEKWARCYFPGARYNIDTSNCAESMNSTFNNARQYSLLPMIDAIVEKLAEWFNKYRKESVAGCDAQKMVPFVENVLHDRCVDASKLPVTELNTFHLEYCVSGEDGKNYVVDLRKKTCSCKCFDIDKYPCVHAIAAAIKCLKEEIRPTDLHDLSDLCSRYYLVEQWALAYYRTIYPVPHMSEWIIPDHIQGLYALPPHYTKKKGRVQKIRHPSVGERRRKHKFVQGRNLASWFESASGASSE